MRRTERRMTADKTEFCVDFKTGKPLLKQAYSPDGEFRTCHE